MDKEYHSTHFITMELAVVRDGEPNAGKWLVVSKHYYFDSKEQAQEVARDLKELFNRNMSAQFGTEWDVEFGVGGGV